MSANFLLPNIDVNFSPPKKPHWSGSVTGTTKPAFICSHGNKVDRRSFSNKKSALSPVHWSSYQSGAQRVN